MVALTFSQLYNKEVVKGDDVWQEVSSWLSGVWCSRLSRFCGHGGAEEKVLQGSDDSDFLRCLYDGTMALEKKNVSIPVLFVSNLMYVI